MPRKPTLVKLTVLVPAETKRALQRFARAKAWSVGTYVRFVLLAHLNAAAEETPRGGLPKEKGKEAEAGRPE